MNDPESQAKYIECYNSFDKEMVKHIPNKLPNNQISHGWAPPKYIDEIGKYAGIHLTTKITSKKKYTESKRRLTKNAKHIGKSTDKCYYIVKTYGELVDTDIDTNYKEFFPVPQYAVYNTSGDYDTKWSRQENRVVAILDCESGDYLNRKKLKSKESMPAEWENGYSKGYTFNDKEQTIMYWLIIW